MKNTALIFLMLFTTSLSLFSQHRVKERDLRGNWKMVIDIDEEFIEEELNGEDVPWLGKFFASSITAVVFEVLDEIDIELRFMDDHRLKIIIEAFGEREVEYGHWYIDGQGALVLDDFDNVEFGDKDDIWLFKNHRLVAYEQKGSRLERKPVYLRKMY